MFVYGYPTLLIFWVKKKKLGSAKFHGVTIFVATAYRTVRSRAQGDFPLPHLDSLFDYDGKYG